LQRLLTQALRKTATLWPALRHASGFVQQAAHVLANEDRLDGATLRERYQMVLMNWQEATEPTSPFADAITHFLKVTASYAPGLFQCADLVDLPRTNNALEQSFGSVRAHERRATGRRGAVPGFVVRRSVRVIASLLTPMHVFTVEELTLHDAVAWRSLRQQLSFRREARCQQFRFRHDPEAYLAALEARLLT
jgi:hypothetical protein